MNQPNFDASSDPHREQPPTDLNGAADSSRSSPRGGSGASGTTAARDLRVPFLGIHFKCCKTYGRIYRNQQRYVYEGRCPKCRGLLTVPIGPGGLDSRFLTAE